MDGGWYLPDGKIPNQKPISRRGPGPRKLGILGMGKEKKRKKKSKVVSQNSVHTKFKKGQT